MRHLCGLHAIRIWLETEEKPREKEMKTNDRAACEAEEVGLQLPTIVKSYLYDNHAEGKRAVSK